MTVRKRKDSPNYMIDFYYRNSKGKLKRFRRITETGTSKKEAEKLERRLQKEFAVKNAQTVVNNIPKQKPAKFEKAAAFSGFAKRWFDLHVKTNNRPSEINKKKSIIRVHLLPFFGHRKLHRITAEDISAFIAQKKKNGLAPKTINNIVGCLRTMLNCAVKWGYLEKNMVLDVNLPKVQKQDFDFYTRSESEIFLRAAQLYEPGWHPFFFTAFRTGMRIGELFALRWKNVNFKRNVIRVQASFDGKVEGSTKSGRGREIPMTPRLVAVLKPLQGNNKQLVFPYKDGEYLNRDRIKHVFWRIIEKAGLRKIRLHDMRHSFASQLVQEGVHLRVVQKWLGHSTILMTERYTHLAPDYHQHDSIALLEPEKSKNVGTVVGTVPISGDDTDSKYMN